MLFDDAYHLLADVVAGLRPRLAEELPEALQTMVKACWHASPAERPAFNDILDVLEVESATCEAAEAAVAVDNDNAAHRDRGRGTPMKLMPPADRHYSSDW